MEYLKPQSPIKIGGNYIYPLTTSDQIINGDGERIKNIADTNEICYLYSAIFSLDSWIGEGPYTQAATLTAVDGGGQVTAQSTLLACVGIDSTLPQETKDAMQSAASDIVNAEKILGANTISVSLTNKPDVEVELYFLIKEGNGTSVPPLDPVRAGGFMKLLWTNSDPESSFEAQTVSLRLSNYDAVYVAVKFKATYNDINMFLCLKNQTTSASVWYSNDTGASGHRGITVNDDGVVFAQGRRMNPFDGTRTVDNLNGIPLYIYGVKF